MTRRWALGALLAVLPLAALTGGCGGSDTSRSTVSVYASDSFDEQFAQVWTRLYKVEVLDTDGNATTVWEDGDGRIVDLRSLHTGNDMRFAYLGTWEVDEDDFKQIRITCDPTMMCMQQKGAAGDGTVVPFDDALPRDNRNRVQITAGLGQVRRFGEAADDLVVDFDLKSYAYQHGKATPSIVEGARTDLTIANRHEALDYSGEVDGLTGSAGNQTFHLKNGDWNGVVVTDAGTVILRRESTAAVTLANRQRVEVCATFDPITRRLRAREIKIEDANSNALYAHEIRGKTVDAAGETPVYGIDVEQCEGFMPEHARVILKVLEGTVLQGPDGAAISTATFQAKAKVAGYAIDAEGTYDAVTHTLTARRVRLIY